MRGRRFAVAGAALLLATSLPAFAQRYVAFGDSITRGLGDTANLGGYPGRLRTLLTQAGQTPTIVNDGKDGETTAEGLSRMTGITGAAADSFLLMEGTNDVSAKVSNETIAQNLKSMVRKAKSNGFGTVLLATVLPRAPGEPVPETREITYELSWSIRQAAVDVGVGQPDPFAVFDHTPNVYTTDYYDNLHPNAAGYDILAKVFADYVLGRDTVAPVSSFIDPLNDSTNVSPAATLQVVLFDPLSGVDQAQSTLLIDDQAIATNVAGNSRRVVLTATPGGLAGRPVLGVRSRDVAGNVVDEDVSQFTIKGTTFLVGDIDQSGRVDGADLVALAYSFGSRSGDGRYRTEADLDRNGRVDGTDLAKLAANFGLSSF